MEILDRCRNAFLGVAGFLSSGTVLRCARASLFAVPILCAAGFPAHAADTYSEDAVKAAYLYRFVGYVEWPGDVSTAVPFTIAVLDAPGVVRELQHVMAGHPLKGGSALVRAITRVEDGGSAQVLYVGPGHAEVLRQAQHLFSAKPILLVTDQQDGLEAGSVLNFLTIDRRVRFEISLTAAERLQLKISSELLSVALRVHGGRRQSEDLCIAGESPPAGDLPCDKPYRMAAFYPGRSAGAGGARR